MSGSIWRMIVRESVGSDNYIDAVAAAACLYAQSEVSIFVGVPLLSTLQ